jgi:hypothetical protein
MLRSALALMTVVVSASAAEAAEPPALCKALHDLADQARQTGQPQRVSIIRGDRALECRRQTPGAATAAFCSAAFAAEPAAAAWMAAECVQTLAADPQITTRPEASGYKTRKAITHLTAKLGGGVRLDMAYAASSSAYAPTVGYDIVVWKAD